MAKKDKPPYDERGYWVEERGRIKGALRKAFRLSPHINDIMQEARVELPALPTKDGKPGKRKRIRYRCAHCGGLFQETMKKKRCVQVDHIEPVIPLWMPEMSMPDREWIWTVFRGIFCKKDNLQVLCSIPKTLNDGKSSCHNIKTQQENYVRRTIAKCPKQKIMDTRGEVLDRYVSMLKKRYLTDKAEKEKKAHERKLKRNSKKNKQSKK